MLQNIRAASKGWISWVIVIAISIPFALWGVERFNTGGSQGEDTLVSIGDNDISYHDFFRELEVYNQRLRQQYGENFNRIDQEKVRQNVLQFVLGKGVLLADALDKGLVTSDKQVRRNIIENEGFQNDDGNGFDAQKYADYLSASNITAPVFEEEMRTSQVNAQYTEGFWDSNFLTKHELSQLYQLLNHKREVAYLILPWEQRKDQVEISEDEVRIEYENNQNRFTIPEKVKVEYVSISINSLSEKVTPNQQQLEEFYEVRKADFSSPEERQIRHILFSQEDKSLADEVLQKIRANENFEALAKEHSIDSLSAEKGGDLGWITRGIMVEDFENAAFTLEQNEVQLISTEFGHHIIEVIGTKASKQPLLKDIEEEIKLAYKLEQAGNEFYNIQEQLSNLAFDHADSLQEIEEKLGLEIQETDWFSRIVGTSSDTLSQYENFREAAFSPQVKNEKLNSAVIDIQGEQAVVLRVKDVQSAYTRTLDEVKDELMEDLRKSKALAKLSEDVSADIKALRTKQLTWKNFMEKYDYAANSLPKVAWISNDDLDENAPAEQTDVYRLAFNHARIRVKNKQEVYLNSNTSLGNVAVVLMSGSKDVEVPEEELLEGSGTWSVMNNFQSSNLRNATLEVLQSRFPIPNVDVSNLGVQQ